MFYSHLGDRDAGHAGNPCPRCGGSLRVLRNGAEIWGDGAPLPVGADLVACKGNGDLSYSSVGQASCTFVAVVGFDMGALADSLRDEVNG